MLALATLENWHIKSLDVYSTYLYGKLIKEIYMKQSEGFRVPKQEHKVLHLLCALYGLKQARLAWWETLNESEVQCWYLPLLEERHEHCSSCHIYLWHTILWPYQSHSGWNQRSLYEEVGMQRSRPCNLLNCDPASNKWLDHCSTSCLALIQMLPTL